MSTTTNPTNSTKLNVYNLIILDASGSMYSLQKAAQYGCNGSIIGIRQLAEEHPDEQEQFLTLITFSGRAIRTIYDCTPIRETQTLRKEDYRPCGDTPLLDAIGESVNNLRAKMEKDENGVAIVTIITDGYENSSREYSYEQIQRLISELKEEGWTFAFMGANQDVTKVCVDLSISVDNARSFAFSEDGLCEAMQMDMQARRRRSDRIRCEKAKLPNLDKEGWRKRMAEVNMSTNYFEE